MIRPVWAIAGVGLLGAVGVAGLAVIAPSGGEGEVVQQVETASLAPSAEDCDPKATQSLGGKLWRWGDLTIVIPEGVLAYGDIDQESRAILVIYPEEVNQGYRTAIDATTGDVISVSNDPSGVRPKEAEIQAALSTISICPFDRANAPWPYSGGQPSTDQQKLGNISYLQPDPAAGIQVLGGGACGGGCRDFIEVRSARSSMAIDAESGRVFESAKIAEEEKEAFDRYLTTVQVNGP